MKWEAMCLDILRDDYITAQRWLEGAMKRNRPREEIEEILHAFYEKSRQFDNFLGYWPI